MAENRDYLVLTMSDDYPCATDFVFGSSVFSCVSLRGLRPHRTRDIRTKSVLIQSTDGNWTEITVPYTDVGHKLRLFICHGNQNSPVGVRTSQDWSTTHWGKQINGLPGDVWVAACSLPQSVMEFKLVSQVGMNVTWESPPYHNKRIKLTAECQVIEVRWGFQEIEQTVDVPPLRRTVDVVVTLPCDMHTMIQNVPGYNLVIHNIKTPDNKLLNQKGHHVSLSWNDAYQAYWGSLSVSGKLDVLRFSLAVMDDFNAITHIDKHCFNQRGPRHREITIPISTDDTIVCQAFVDVRPLKWCTSVGSTCMAPAGTAARSLYNLIHDTHNPMSHSRSDTSHAITSGDHRTATTNTDNMALYRDVFMDIQADPGTLRQYRNWSLASNSSLYQDLVRGQLPLLTDKQTNHTPALCDQHQEQTPLNTSTSKILNRSISRTLTRSISRTLRSSFSFKSVRDNFQKLRSRHSHHDNDYQKDAIHPSFLMQHVE